MVQSLFKVVVNPDKCTGCRTCENVCSLRKWGECNPERSAIRCIRSEENGLVSTIPVLCQQCEDPICEAVCPVEALHRNFETGAIIVDQEKCLGCRTCVFNCPFGGTAVDVVTGYATKCDLCDGDPNCVKFCSKSAIEYIRTDKISVNKKRKGTEKYLDFLKGGI